MTMSRRTAHLPTAVYRIYDADDRLIYVGQSQRIGLRMRMHSAHSWWYALMDRIEVEYYPNRAAGGVAERLAIQEEQPAFNVMSTGRNYADFSHITDADRDLCRRWIREAGHLSYHVPLGLRDHLSELDSLGIPAAA